MTTDELHKLKLYRHIFGQVSVKDALDAAIHADAWATSPMRNSHQKRAAKKASDRWLDYAELLEKERGSK